MPPGVYPHKRRRPETCTIDGCNKPHLARGYCGAHWARWRALGSATAPDPRIIHGGASKTGALKSEYRAWHHMRERCTKPSCKNWPNYGGRGITVCDRWRESFLNFIADMGPKPAPNYTLDRIDNNGNYEPGNCRWATYSDQNRNRRKVRKGPSTEAQLAALAAGRQLRIHRLSTSTSASQSSG